MPDEKKTIPDEYADELTAMAHIMARLEVRTPAEAVRKVEELADRPVPVLAVYEGQSAVQWVRVADEIVRLVGGVQMEIERRQ